MSNKCTQKYYSSWIEGVTEIMDSALGKPCVKERLNFRKLENVLFFFYHNFSITFLSREFFIGDKNIN